MADMYKVGSHKTTIATVEGMIRVTYHSTVVVSFDHEKVILKTGGWHTATTKTRMNQTANQYGLGFRVFQKDYSWFVVLESGKIVPFVEGMEIKRGNN